MPPPILESPAPIPTNKIEKDEPESVKETEEMHTQDSKKDCNAGARRGIWTVEAVGHYYKEGYGNPDSIQSDSIGQKPWWLGIQAIVLDAIVIHYKVYGGEYEQENQQHDNEEDFVLNITKQADSSPPSGSSFCWAFLIY